MVCKLYFKKKKKPLLLALTSHSNISYLSTVAYQASHWISSNAPHLQWCHRRNTEDYLRDEFHSSPDSAPNSHVTSGNLHKPSLCLSPPIFTVIPLWSSPLPCHDPDPFVGIWGGGRCWAFMSSFHHSLLEAHLLPKPQKPLYIRGLSNCVSNIHPSPTTSYTLQLKRIINSIYRGVLGLQNKWTERTKLSHNRDKPKQFSLLLTSCISVDTTEELILIRFY